MTYIIFRHFNDARKSRVLVRGVSEDVAKAFCDGPWARGKLKRTAVEWFYGFEKE
jgi:hypothetical protein